jgi:predicted aspartyl protease
MVGQLEIVVRVEMYPALQYRVPAQVGRPETHRAFCVTNLHVHHMSNERHTTVMNRIPTLIALMTLAHSAGAQAPASPSCSSYQAKPRDGAPVDLPVTIRSNHFVITACRGDRPLSFVLDTGAPFSIIDLSLAKDLGIETGQSFSGRGAGSGSIAAASVRRDSARIAGTDIVVPFSQAMDFRALNAVGRLKIEGILGADFIDRFVLGLDYRDSVVRVYDRSTFAYAGTGAVVPFTMSRGFIFVNGELGLLDGAKIPGRFVVDVGASGSLALAKPFVDANRLRERAGPTVRREAGRGVGGVVMADVGRAQTFSLGSATLQHPIITLSGDSAGVLSGSSLGDGNIGGDILRRYTVLLDYARQRLIFERHAGSDDPFEIDMTGLSMLPAVGGTALVVQSVVPRSAAANVGIVAGDTIVAIDNTPATLVQLDAVRPRMLREGEQLTFTIRRKGTDVELRVVTKRLV